MSSHRVPVRVVVPSTAQLVIVGTGGTGGYVLQQVARLMYSLMETGNMREPIMLIDGDTVEEKNLLRQYFLPKDIGRNKAVALADRYSAAYGIEIEAWPNYIAEDTNLCQDNRTHHSTGGLIAKGAIVVGCVDNGPTRRFLHEKLKTLDHVVYIDSGNDAARPPESIDMLDRYDLHRAKQEGWAGQVVCGVRANGEQKLPFPAEVLPSLLEGEDDPNKRSCNDVSVSNPQRQMTNLMAATCVMMYLHSLLSDGTITNHRTFFDANKGFTRSDPAIDHLLEVGI